MSGQRVTKGRVLTHLASGEREPEVVYASVADALLAALIEIESADGMQRSRHIRDMARKAIAAATDNKEQRK